MKRLLSLLMGLIVLTSIMCTKDKDTDNEKVFTSVQILLNLIGPKYQGTYYPDFLEVTTDYAIWIEDANREYVKTLQITPVAVTVDSAHGSHIEHLPGWSEAAGITYADLENETDDGVAPSFDGITGASPFFAPDAVEITISVIWDLTDAEEQPVGPGVFYACAEAANIIKDGDSEAETVTRFEINAESICIRMDLENGTYQPDPPTENLTSMKADFNTDMLTGKHIMGID